MKTEKICAPHCKKRQRKLSRKNRSGTRFNSESKERRALKEVSAQVNTKEPFS